MTRDVGVELVVPEADLAMAAAMAHFVPSVGFLGDRSGRYAGYAADDAGALARRQDAALQRALFEEEEEEEQEVISAPLGPDMFAVSPFSGNVRSTPQACALEAADEEQWLDEVGAMRDQIEHARHDAETRVRRTELQAARLAEVLSRTADGRVAAARRWAAREVHRHESLRREKNCEWADIVADVKMEAAEFKEDLRDARAEKARLQKQLANAALRSEKERRAAEKALENAVRQAREETEAKATAKYDAVIAASDERARRAETRLASAAADWAERLAAAEAREAHAVDLRRETEEQVTAVFTEQLTSALARAAAAEKAQQGAETRCVELEKKSQEGELRRVVGREAAVVELQATQAKLEEKNFELSQVRASAEATVEQLRAELSQKDQRVNDMVQRANEQQSELAAMQEQLKRSVSEISSLRQLLDQRSAALALLGERQTLRWAVYRRIWIRMSCRLLIGARSDIPLFAPADSTASDTDTEAEPHVAPTVQPGRPSIAASVCGATASRKRLRSSQARTLGRQRRVLTTSLGSDNESASCIESLQCDKECEDVRSPELEPDDLQDFDQHQYQRDAEPNLEADCAYGDGEEAGTEIRETVASAGFVPAEPTNRAEAEKFAAWQLESDRVQSGECTSDYQSQDCQNQTQPQVGATAAEAPDDLRVGQQGRDSRAVGTDGADAIFPLLERNPWLVAVMPLVLLLMMMPLVIFMTPELPSRLQ